MPDKKKLPTQDDFDPKRLIELEEELIQLKKEQGIEEDPNNASILIMAPIGMALAQSMGIEPYAFVMATFVGCLSCFCTPMATPALAYVMEPGGYRYKDFLKAGFMMQIVYFVVGMVVIPLVWL